jgi:hypothetical protein
MFVIGNKIWKYPRLTAWSSQQNSLKVFSGFETTPKQSSGVKDPELFYSDFSHLP